MSDAKRNKYREKSSPGCPAHFVIHIYISLLFILLLVFFCCRQIVTLKSSKFAYTQAVHRTVVCFRTESMQRTTQWEKLLPRIKWNRTNEWTNEKKKHFFCCCWYSCWVAILVLPFVVCLPRSCAHTRLTQIHWNGNKIYIFIQRESQF